MIYQVAVVLAALAVASANLHDRAYYEEKFFNWLKEHDVTAESGPHFVQMLQNFADNDDLIETHNAGNESYTLGHNRFSHMSLADWKEFVSRGLQRPEASTEPEFVLHGVEDVSALPASVDWRTGSTVAVTKVKDQGQCGSCWSFSATGALEGAYAIKYGKLVDFSPQHFVDCDTRSNSNNKGTDMGCNGGLMDSAFSWASKNGGLCEWNDYKYTSGTTKKSGTCSESSCKKADHSPKSYTDVAKNSDSALMTALVQQPVSVAIEADTKEFQLYKSGVFTAKCGAKLDHGVLAVGYGHDDKSKQDYWTVKNSWGESWGDKGYILLQRGGTGLAKEGQCGILSGPPSFPNYK